MPVPQVLDAVLDALEGNTRVEALYIQNFEQASACDMVGKCCYMVVKERLRRIAAAIVLACNSAAVLWPGHPRRHRTEASLSA